MSSSRTILLNGGGGTFDTQTNTDTLNGVISGVGSLTKISSGTLILTAGNTYGGGTNIDGGTLQMGATGSIPSTGVVFIASGATFDLHGFNETIGNLSGAGTVLTGGAKLTVGDASNETFSGMITGAGGSLTKVGTGTLFLSGSSSYSGGTTIGAGILEVGTNTSLDSGPITFTGSSTLQSGAPGLTISNSPFTINSGVTATLDSQGNTFTINSVISGNGGVKKVGSGILAYTANNTYLGGTDIAAGTLQMGIMNAMPSTGLVTVENNATFDLNGFNQTIGNFTGGGSCSFKLRSHSHFRRRHKSNFYGIDFRIWRII